MDKTSALSYVRARWQGAVYLHLRTDRHMHTADLHHHYSPNPMSYVAKKMAVYRTRIQKQEQRGVHVHLSESRRVMA